MPRKLFFRLKDGFPRVKLCFCVLCVLTYLALIRVSGAKLWGLFVFFLCAAVYLYLCCFSERMRKLFRKNEKNVLRFCNKKAKEKRRLQRVKKPM